MSLIYLKDIVLWIYFFFFSLDTMIFDIIAMLMYIYMYVCCYIYVCMLLYVYEFVCICWWKNIQIYCIVPDMVLHNIQCCAKWLHFTYLILGGGLRFPLLPWYHKQCCDEYPCSCFHETFERVILEYIQKKVWHVCQIF